MFSGPKNRMKQLIKTKGYSYVANSETSKTTACKVVRYNDINGTQSPRGEKPILIDVLEDHFVDEQRTFDFAPCVVQNGHLEVKLLFDRGISSMEVDAITAHIIHYHARQVVP